MKKRIFGFMTLMTAAVMILSGCATVGASVIRGAGPVVSQTFDVGNFTDVSVGGSRIVIFREAAEHSVTIEMQESLFEYLTLEVRGGTLHVGQRAGVGIDFGRYSPRVYIYAPSLEGINLSGSSNTEGWDKIFAQNFFVSASGSSSIDIALEVETLEMHLSGSSRATLIGSADDVDISLSGSSRVLAEDLQAGSVDVGSSGSARVYIAVSDSLNVNGSGSSRVRYAGNPSVSVRTSGSSSVSPIN
ncbi:MAG: DUF2807 domain-containing protein [Defluviitaleaceae bacterium]|nr:DUF2807 domain-containing protein [Defluviitaleaceae bacterium]